jgi:hypothetical protein
MASFQNESAGSAPSQALWGKERRAHPRFFLQGIAVIRILPYGPDVLGALLDLSEGGCGIEFGIGIPAQAGAQVEVNLNVRGLTLQRAGIIRRIEVIRRMEKETRAGIEFVQASNWGTGPGNLAMRELLRQLEMERPARA